MFTFKNYLEKSITKFLKDCLQECFLILKNKMFIKKTTYYIYFYT